MPRPTTAVLSAATVVAALWLSGCDREEPDAAVTSAQAPTTTTVAPQNAPLPDQAALLDLLGRLADPAVPGTAKLPLVQGATAGDAVTLDNFTKALVDNHMVPLTFTASGLTWSDQRPGDVVANITASGPDPKTGGLSFPMEFTPAPDGWQLSRQTADMLLVFGDSAIQPLPPDLAPPTMPAGTSVPAAPTPTR